MNDFDLFFVAALFVDEVSVLDPDVDAGCDFAVVLRRTRRTEFVVVIPEIRDWQMHLARRVALPFRTRDRPQAERDFDRFLAADFVDLDRPEELFVAGCGFVARRAGARE